MQRCDHCQGRLRLSRALNVMECMECGLQCEVAAEPALKKVDSPTEPVIEAQPTSDSEAPQLKGKDKKLKPLITVCPEGLKVSSRQESWEVIVCQKHPYGFAYMGLAVFWSVAITVLIFPAVGLSSWIGLLFLCSMVHLLIQATVKYFNHPTLNVVPDQLSLINQPFPIGNAKHLRSSIQQIISVPHPSGAWVTLGVLDVHGKQHLLIPYLERNHALFIEQHIESFWGIIDDPSQDYERLGESILPAEPVEDYSWMGD